MKVLGRWSISARRARRLQQRRELEERQLADTAPQAPEARTHQRRAEKAAYLRGKLEERERSETGSGSR